VTERSLTGISCVMMVGVAEWLVVVVMVNDKNGTLLAFFVRRRRTWEARVQDFRPRLRVSSGSSRLMTLSAAELMW